MKKKEKIKFWIAFGGVVIAIFLCLTFLFLAVYKFQWNNRFINFAKRVVPFPAVYINGAGLISLSEITSNTASVKKFYESQDFEKIGMRIDFGTDQGQKRLKIKEKEILSKMIENKIIEALAKKRKIFIADSAVSEAVDSSIQNFGDRNKLISELARLYGWTMNDFEEKVVKPELYADRLYEVYAGEIDTSAQVSKINALYGRVTSKKEDFSKVASENSEGKSAESGGDLGWSTKDQFIEPVGEKAFSMKEGEISPVIESPLGFHILKLEEKKSEDGQDLVHVRQIFVKKTTFSEWLKEKMKDYKVIVFLQDYQWNASEGQIEFTSSDLRKFEENLDVNSPGDPSVFP